MSFLVRVPALVAVGGLLGACAAAAPRPPSPSPSPPTTLVFHAGHYGGAALLTGKLITLGANPRCLGAGLEHAVFFVLRDDWAYDPHSGRVTDEARREVARVGDNIVVGGGLADNAFTPPSWCPPGSKAYTVYSMRTA